MQDLSVTIDGRPIASHWQWSVRAALVCAVAILFLNFGWYVVSAGQAIEFPFQLDYGEGIVWQQMRLILSGEGYGPIDSFPAIVFHYPPLYHLASGMLAATTGLDQLAAGRLLSIISTFVLAGLTGAIVAQLSQARADRAPAWLGGLLAALIVFSTKPVQSWSLLMRVDMMSIALSFAGLYFALRALTKPGAIHVAALLFVAAVYTKQTALAAPVAVFAVLLFVRPRTAFAGIATGLAASLAILAGLIWATDGGFLRHILLYNVNRFILSSLPAMGWIIVTHSIYVMVAMFGIGVRWLRRSPGYFTAGGWRGLRQRLASSPADAGYAMALAYLALATLMLVMALKSGASINYFAEWGSLIALFVGLALVDTFALALRRPVAHKPDALIILLTLGLAVQAAVLTGEVSERYQAASPKRTEFAQLASFVRAAPSTVISDDMVIVLRGGKEVVWEPSIFAELASKGVWDEREFIRKIEAHEFAFIITEGEPGIGLFDARHTPMVARAMWTAYPVERRLAGYHLRFPPGALPAYAAGLR